jgi:hypothetical protein
MSGSNCSVSPVANDADQVGSLILIFLKKIGFFWIWTLKVPKKGGGGEPGSLI